MNIATVEAGPATPLPPEEGSAANLAGSPATLAAEQLGAVPGTEKLYTHTLADGRQVEGTVAHAMRVCPVIGQMSVERAQSFLDRVARLDQLLNQKNAQQSVTTEKNDSATPQVKTLAAAAPKPKVRLSKAAQETTAKPPVAAATPELAVQANDVLDLAMHSAIEVPVLAAPQHSVQQAASPRRTDREAVVIQGSPRVETVRYNTEASGEPNRIFVAESAEPAPLIAPSAPDRLLKITEHLRLTRPDSRTGEPTLVPAEASVSELLWAKQATQNIEVEDRSLADATAVPQASLHPIQASEVNPVATFLDLAEAAQLVTAPETPVSFVYEHTALDPQALRNNALAEIGLHQAPEEGWEAVSLITEEVTNGPESYEPTETSAQSPLVNPATSPDGAARESFELLSPSENQDNPTNGVNEQFADLRKHVNDYPLGEALERLNHLLAIDSADSMPTEATTTNTASDPAAQETSLRLEAAKPLEPGTPMHLASVTEVTPGPLLIEFQTLAQALTAQLEDTHYTEFGAPTATTEREDTGVAAAWHSVQTMDSLLRLAELLGYDEPQKIVESTLAELTEQSTMLALLREIKQVIAEYYEPETLNGASTQPTTSRVKPYVSHLGNALLALIGRRSAQKQTAKAHLLRNTVSFA